MADNTILNAGSGGDTVASDDVTTMNGGASSGVKVQRVKAGYGDDATYTDASLTKPLPTHLRDSSGNDMLGSKALASSIPVASSTEDIARLGIITETAPASDTASSGLNGRLQRIAQRITSLISLLPSALGQTTKALSLSVSLPNDINIVSTANSSTVTLGIGGVFTGTSEDISQYSTISVTVFSDVASAADGLSLQQSSNGTNWDNLDVFTIPAATGKTFSVGAAAKFFRAVYTNGGTAQASFRLQTIHHIFASKSSSQRPQDARTNDNDFEEVSGFNHVFNGSSWDRLRSGQSAATATLTGFQNVLAGGIYNSTTPVLTNGQTISLQLDPNGNLKVAPLAKATYRASTIIPLVAAVTVNVPFFNIIGSATKTITVKRITASGTTLTAVGYYAINVEKLSTASTAGTSTTLVTTSLDTNNAAGTAVVKAYTVGPTKGTLVGTIKSWRALWQATVAAAGGSVAYYDFDFGDIIGSHGVVLRGVAQELALTFPVVLASAGTLSVDIEWTEE